MKRNAISPMNTKMQLNPKTMQLSELNYWIFAGLAIVIIGFFCFFKLGQLPAQDWDEARHGISAYEMMKSGNWVVNTFQYQADYYNLKPPLSFWAIIGGYQLFGFNLFGMRFYSAASFFLTAVAIGWFCKKRYGNLESIIALFLIACNSPFYTSHFARHGDADALFCLFTVISILAMICMDEQPWMPMICSGAFSLAFLTKSWHALFVVAVVGIYMLWSKMIFRLSLKQWIGFILAGALPILSWVVLRWQYDGSRFFTEMIRVDLLNRSVQVLEGHDGSFLYYIERLIRQPSVTGFLPIVAILTHLFFRVEESKQNRRLPDIPRFRVDFSAYFIWIIIPLLLFSIVKTKLPWYVIPIEFPIILVTALLLAQMIRCCSRKMLLWKCLIIGACMLLMESGIALTWGEIHTPQQDPLQTILSHEQSNLCATREKTVYFDVGPGGVQKYLLLGELYYDWNCIIGGAKQFLNTPSGELLVTCEDLYLQNQFELDESCSLLLRQDGCVILEKQ
ncbi:MAG: glycosyltransferase family 39 protein [Clostridia bacterium]